VTGLRRDCSMERNRGGRGHRNPWISRTMRVPEPLFPIISEIVGEFIARGGQISDRKIQQPSQQIIQQSSYQLSRAETELLGEQLIKQRKSLKTPCQFCWMRFLENCHRPRRPPMTTPPPCASRSPNDFSLGFPNPE